MNLYFGKSGFEHVDGLQKADILVHLDALLSQVFYSRLQNFPVAARVPPHFYANMKQGDVQLQQVAVAHSLVAMQRYVRPSLRVRQARQGYATAEQSAESEQNCMRAVGVDLRKIKYYSSSKHINSFHFQYRKILFTIKTNQRVQSPIPC